MPILSVTVVKCSSLKMLKRLAFSISIVINLFVFVVLFTPLAEQLYKPLIVNEKPYKSDVIVILSCFGYETGLPDFETVVRLKKGLELYSNGWADKIICAGGYWFDEIQKSMAELMKETLILYGMPSSDILTHDETANTYADITYLMEKFGGEFDYNKSIFVTSSYHTYRVKQILRKKNITARVVSAEPYQLTPRVCTERLDLFREIVREYLAICYFKAKGYI